MRFLSTLVLSTIAIGSAAAASIANIHSGIHNHAARHAEHMKKEAMKRSAFLNDADAGRIMGMKFKAVGANAGDRSGKVWIGGDGAYSNEYTNNAGQPLILVVWGAAASWVVDIQPYITYSLAPGQSVTLSFADGISGAWAAIYDDTQMVNGQISNTWGEFTFGQWGVVDVSREVNMNGHGMSIVGPTCTTDMDTCVFICPNNEPVCMYNYILKNCENGSQPGANYGMYEGSPSGGCGGMGTSAKLKTSLY